MNEKISTEENLNLQQAFNFKKWIDENRHLLKPPVGNKCLFHHGTFIVMAVGGPNLRTDFHVNQTDEFFYQLEGDMFLRTIQGKNVQETPINEGEVFMLPAGIPHSPQRMEHSVGLVVEKRRTTGEKDGLQWYCCKCHNLLYQEFFFLTDIETQFPIVFDRYYNSSHTHCENCGYINGRSWDV